MKTIPEIAIWLGGKQVELFESNAPIYLSAFCDSPVIRGIICSYYFQLVNENKILAIENVDPEIKKELKSAAIDMAAGRLDTTGCVQLCKLIQVLSYHKII
jgi:hypothetical protein